DYYCSAWDSSLITYIF
nr:immunoglobulin light chain junction region [Macaca mulatta]MOX43822.1 immunoglobulin light chain junction region [Macaca mulatta]MOX46134.1 immunoglobulin light chain junction region [Macaca mulatta]MOX46245.1 immunoglobulin light chain junction region [Macaca mulatta]MOX46457.1 immunoglobulin light chain junction region [Macaca mulatta]